MTTMRRLRVEWNGLSGLPGISTFYVGPASPNVSAFVTYFNAVKALFPSALTWNIPSSGDEIDDATGALTGSWVGSGGGSVVATGGVNPYAAGVGYVTSWQTGIIHGGRRVKGRTFMAPTVTGMFDTNGTLTGPNLATAQAAASALAASGVAWGVWSRPTVGRAGLYCAVNAATVADQVTSLRSRRS